MNSRFLLPEWITISCVDIHVMLTAFTSILIGLYWLELMKINTPNQSFLIQYRIHYLSFTGFLIFTRIIFIFLMGFSVLNSSFATSFTGTIICVSVILSIILLICTGIVILQHLKKFPTKNKSLFNQLRNLLIICVVSSFIYVILVCFSVSMIGSSESFFPRLILYWSSMILYLTSFIKILVFIQKRKNLKTKTSNSGRSSDKGTS